MKTQTVALVFLAVVVLLLLGGVALAQSGERSPTVWYAVQHGTVSGSGYHLTSSAWQVSGTASGTGYHLLSPASPTLRGNGCCCTFLPCMLRHH